MDRADSFAHIARNSNEKLIRESLDDSVDFEDDDNDRTESFGTRSSRLLMKEEKNNI